jgi:2-polyprenyl-3-methyl-5-hydroxy-6-metoxy-1,4-benzoquinol methylase
MTNRLLGAPTIAEQRAYYDAWNTVNRNCPFDQVNPEIRLRARWVVETVRSLGLSRPAILEVGCGTGWASERLAQIGTVTALDLSPAAVEIARARVSGVEFIAANFLEHPVAPGAFDVAVSIETLFYVADQRRFVERIARALRPRGYLLLTTINKFVYERSGDVGPAEPGQLRRWLSRTQTSRLLAAEFQIVRMATIEPRGHGGVLRLVNSAKVDRVLGAVHMAGPAKRVKERLGLGGGVVVLARKRA